MMVWSFNSKTTSGASSGAVRREGLAYRDNNFWLLLEEYEKLGKGGKTDFFCSAYNATTPMRNLQ
jgi:hypothetical protein